MEWRDGSPQLHEAFAVFAHCRAGRLGSIQSFDTGRRRVTEQTHLAAIMRQLDMIDRLAVHSASLPRPDDVRYHFDYWHLQKDIERVHQGIRDYLTPAATATRPSGAVG